MRFRVFRSSDCTETTQPCDEAVAGDFTYVATSPYATVEEYEKAKPHHPKWHSIGVNHRVVNGQIARDYSGRGWFVDFEAIEGLVCFMHNYGPCLLTKAENGNDPVIEIYDRL